MADDGKSEKKVESAKPLEAAKSTDKDDTHAHKEASAGVGDLNKRMGKERSEQKDPDRPPKSTTHLLGRPQIFSTDGEDIVKGKQKGDAPKTTEAHDRQDDSHKGVTRGRQQEKLPEVADLPPKSTTRMLGRPEIVGSQGEVLVKGSPPTEAGKLEASQFLSPKALSPELSQQISEAGKAIGEALKAIAPDAQAQIGRVTEGLGSFMKGMHSLSGVELGRDSQTGEPRITINTGDGTKLPIPGGAGNLEIGNKLGFNLSWDKDGPKLTKIEGLSANVEGPLGISLKVPVTEAGAGIENGQFGVRAKVDSVLGEKTSFIPLAEAPNIPADLKSMLDTRGARSPATDAIPPADQTAMVDALVSGQRIAQDIAKKLAGDPVDSSVSDVFRIDPRRTDRAGEVGGRYDPADVAYKTNPGKDGSDTPTIADRVRTSLEEARTGSPDGSQPKAPDIAGTAAAPEAGAPAAARAPESAPPARAGDAASSSQSTQAADGSQPKDAPAKADKPAEPPLNDEQKKQLEETAKKIHYLAGFESKLYSKADTKAINEVLKDLSPAQLEELKNQWKKLPGADKLETDLGKCGGYQGSGTDVLKGLLQKDDATRAATEIHRCLTEHNEFSGRSNWAVDKDLRLTLSHMTAKQLAEADAKYRDLYKDEHKGIAEAIAENKHVPEDIKSTLGSYMKGVDHQTPADTLKMANAAMNTGNLDMFKEVMATSSKEGRDKFLAGGGEERMQQAFGGIISDQQLQQAKGYAHGDQNLITVQEVLDNTGSKSLGYFTNREGVDSALDKMSDEQRKQYFEGKKLEKQENLTPDQKTAVEFYQKLHGAMEGAVRPAELMGLEDRIAIKGGSIISEVSKGQGYLYNSGADQHLHSIENMSEQQWKDLREHMKTDPTYRKHLQETLEAMNTYDMGRINGNDINKIMDVFDKKMAANTFEESKAAGQPDLADKLDSQTSMVFGNDRAGMLDAISKMPPDQQEKYRHDEKFRHDVDEQLLKLKQFSSDDAYKQAERMLSMIRHDDHGTLGQIANMKQEDRSALADPQKGAKALEEWQKKVNENMPAGEGRDAALRMLNQIKQGHDPELKDINVKLAGYGSQWTGDPRDVVKSMEQAFKDDPTLHERVKNPKTEADLELSQKFKELAHNALGDEKYNKYGQTLIESQNGRLDLATRIEMDKGSITNDRQGALKNLSEALKDDPKLFEKNPELKEQFMKSMDGWMQNDAQREVAEKVIGNKGELAKEDELRSHILDYGHSDQIMKTLRELKPGELDHLQQEYAKKYHSDLQADLQLKLSSSDAKEAMRQFWKPSSAGELFDNVKQEYLDSRQGFGSMFADKIGGSGTGHQLDNNINHMAATLADAQRSGQPLSPEQQKKLQEQIQADVSHFTQDLTNFQASKSACAEYTANAVMAAIAVAGSSETGGGSLSLLGRMATFAGRAEVNAVMNTGLQMAMLGSDYDMSVKNVVSELATGYVDGQIFNKVGAVEVGAMLGIGGRAAEQTAAKAVTEMLEKEGLGLAKSLTTSEAKTAFQTALKDELATAMRHGMLQGEKQISHEVLEQATSNALKKVFENEARAGGEKLTAEAIEKTVKERFESMARHRVGDEGFTQMEKQIKKEALEHVGGKTVEELSATQLKQFNEMVGHQMAQAAVRDLGGTVSHHLDAALMDQSKSFVKNLVNYAGEHTNPAVRYAQGVGLAALGGAGGGAITGTLHGLTNWDASKSVDENLTAMREHISGSILSAMMGAAQMHPLSMITHNIMHPGARSHAPGHVGSPAEHEARAARSHAPEHEARPGESRAPEHEARAVRSHAPEHEARAAGTPTEGKVEASRAAPAERTSSPEHDTGKTFNKDVHVSEQEGRVEKVQLGEKSAEFHYKAGDPPGTPSEIKFNDGRTIERVGTDQYKLSYPEGTQHAPESIKGKIHVEPDGTLKIENSAEIARVGLNGNFDRVSNPNFLPEFSENSTHSKQHWNEANKALLELPLAMREAVADKGIKVELVSKMHEAGITAHDDTALGGWNTLAKKLVVSENGLIEGMDHSKAESYRQNKNVAGTLRHEFGHALDLAAKEAGGHRLAQTPELMKAYEADLNRMSLVDKRKNKYFTTRGNPDEAYAEIFGSMYGGGGRGDPERFHQLFPKTEEVIRKQLAHLDPNLVSKPEAHEPGRTPLRAASPTENPRSETHEARPVRDGNEEKHQSAAGFQRGSVVEFHGEKRIVASFDPKNGDVILRQPGHGKDAPIQALRAPENLATDPNYRQFRIGDETYYRDLRSPDGKIYKYVETQFGDPILIQNPELRAVPREQVSKPSDHAKPPEAEAGKTAEKQAEKQAIQPSEHEAGTKQTKPAPEIYLNGKKLESGTGEIVVGRDHQKDAFHKYLHSSVSREHLVMRQDAEGRLFVKDVSTNGTFREKADGTWERLPKNQEVEVKRADRLRLGSDHGAELNLKERAETPSPKTEQPAPTARPIPGKRVEFEGDKHFVSGYDRKTGDIILTRPGHGADFALHPRELTPDYSKMELGKETFYRNKSGEVFRLMGPEGNQALYQDHSMRVVSRERIGEIQEVKPKAPQVVPSPEKGEDRIARPLTPEEVQRRGEGQYLTQYLRRQTASEPEAIRQTNEMALKHQITEKLRDGFQLSDHEGVGVGSDGRSRYKHTPDIVVDRMQDKVLTRTIAEAHAKFDHLKGDPVELAKELTKFSKAALHPKNWTEAQLDAVHDKFSKDAGGKRLLLGELMSRAQKGESGGVCAQQALLLKVLGDSFGIETRLVYGHSGFKGPDGKLPPTAKANHAWTEMNIDGQWYIFDPRQKTFGKSVDSDPSHHRVDDRMALHNIRQVLPVKADGTPAKSWDEAVSGAKDRVRMPEPIRASEHGKGPEMPKDIGLDIKPNDQVNFLNTQGWRVTGYNSDTGNVVLVRDYTRNTTPQELLALNPPENIRLNGQVTVRDLLTGQPDAGWTLVGKDANGKPQVFKKDGLSLEASPSELAQENPHLVKEKPPAPPPSNLGSLDNSQQAMQQAGVELKDPLKGRMGSEHVAMNAELRHPNGTVQEAIFHRTDNRGPVGEDVRNRFRKEAAVYKINELLGFDNGFPATVPREVQMHGKPAPGYLQEKVGVSFSEELSKLTVDHTGKLNKENFSKLLNDHPELSKAIEQALVERLIYGCADNVAGNWRAVQDGKGLKVQNIDLDQAFRGQTVAELLNSSDGKNAGMSRWMLDHFRGKELSPETRTHLNDFVNRFDTPEGLKSLASSGLTEKESREMLDRARSFLDHGSFPPRESQPRQSIRSSAPHEPTGAATDGAKNDGRTLEKRMNAFTAPESEHTGADTSDAQRARLSRLRGGVGFDSQFKRTELPDNQVKVEGNYQGAGHFIQDGAGRVVSIVDTHGQEYTVSRNQSGQIQEIASPNERFVPHGDGRWEHTVIKQDTVTGLTVGKDGLVFKNSDDAVKGREVEERITPSVFDSQGRLSRFGYFEPETGNSRFTVTRDSSGQITEIASDRGERFVPQSDGKWQHLSPPKIEEVSGLTVHKDGSIEYQNGSKETLTKHPDGSLEKKAKNSFAELSEIDHAAERNRIQQLVQDVSPSAMGRERFLNQIKDFDAHGAENGIAPSERAKLYHHLSEMITARDAIVPAGQRIELAQQIMRDCVGSLSINQGAHDTCNVTALSAQVYCRTPSDNARIIKEVALTGHFTDSEGHTIQLRKTDIVREMESRRESLRPDSAEKGLRSHADQILQTAAVNAYFQNRPTPLRYELHTSEIPGRSSERLVNLEEPPPVRETPGSFFRDRLKFATQLTEQKIPEREGSAFAGLGTVEERQIYKQLTGKNDFKEVNNNFNAVHEFAAALEKAEPSRKNPVAIGVHTFTEPFYRDSYQGKAGGSGGWHVVNITGLERNEAGEITGVYVANQWGKEAQHTQETGKPIKLRDLYLSSYGGDVHRGNMLISELGKDVAADPDNLVKRLELLRNQEKYFFNPPTPRPHDDVKLLSPEEYLRELHKLKKDLPRYETAVDEGRLSNADLEYGRKSIDAQIAETRKHLAQQTMLGRIASRTPWANRLLSAIQRATDLMYPEETD